MKNDIQYLEDIIINNELLFSFRFASIENTYDNYIYRKIKNTVNKIEYFIETDFQKKLYENNILIYNSKMDKIDFLNKILFLIYHNKWYEYKKKMLEYKNSEEYFFKIYNINVTLYKDHSIDYNNYIEWLKENKSSKNE